MFLIAKETLRVCIWIEAQLASVKGIIAGDVESYFDRDSTQGGKPTHRRDLVRFGGAGGGKVARAGELSSCQKSTS